MRLNRFYTERTNLTEGSSVKLSDLDAGHIRKVLRLKKGDKILIFNGEKEFLAELRFIRKDAVNARLIEVTKEEDFSKEFKVEITLFQGLLKSGKFDFIVEKSTEIGIDNIIPVETEFSQTKHAIAEKKLPRWKKIAISASKQSERIRVPEIVDPIKFEEIENLIKNFDAVYFFTIPRQNISQSLTAMDFKEVIAKEVHTEFTKVAYIVGAEGGFSPKEHELAKSWNLNFVKFGKTVLRSETAAISILSILQYIYND